MPAYFETGALSNGQAAWHGLGTVLPKGEFMTLDNFEKLAQLEDPVKVPVYLANGDEIPNTFAIQRPKDQKVLHVVTGTYEIETLERSKELIRALVAVSGEEIKVETAMSLQGGKVVTICCRLKEFQVLGDVFFPFLSLANYHGGGSRKVGLVNIRPVCKNTYSAGEAQAAKAKRLYTARHTKGSLEVSEENLKKAREILQLAELKGEALKELAQKLVAKKIYKSDYLNLANLLFPDPPEIKEELPTDPTTEQIAAHAKSLERTQKQKEIVNEKRSLLFKAADAQDLANFKNTAWGALGAVTAFSSHVTTGTKDTRPEVLRQRQEKRFLENMAGSNLEKLALEFLLQLN